jgi:hypothetical protein
LSPEEGVMQCPFGEEVGAPPSIVRCGRGFPGCACADEWFLSEQDRGNEQSEEVMAWWRERDGL